MQQKSSSTLAEILNIKADDDNSYLKTRALIFEQINIFKTPMDFSSLWDRYYQSIQHQINPDNKGFVRNVYCNRHYTTPETKKQCVTVDPDLYYSGFWASIAKETAQEYDLVYTDEGGETHYRTTIHLPLFKIPMKHLSEYSSMIQQYNVPIIEKTNIRKIDKRYEPIPFPKRSEEYRRLKKNELQLFQDLCKTSDINALVYFMLQFANRR